MGVAQGARASGFVWKSGWIVTADEAPSEATRYAVGFSDGARFAATLHGRDPSTDVALLKLDQEHGVPTPLDALPVKTGAMTLAMGSAGGNTLAAFGVVTHASDAWRSMRGGKIDARIDLGLRLDRRAEGGLAFDMRRGTGF